MKQAGQYYWYHNDHLGTPQVMTTSSGAVVWSAKYTSFGKATVDSGSTVVNPLRYPGQYEDAETGLHYNWLRYYDSIIGRYLKEDPIGLWGGINYFTYVENDPNNWIDPKGLKRCCPGDGEFEKCKSLCDARGSEILVCETVENPWQIKTNCSCTDDKRWGGYREGRPGIPDGSKRLRRDVRKIKSDDFKKFLDNHDISKKQWKKVMETYETPNGKIVERHYWEGPGGRSFYHK